MFGAVTRLGWLPERRRHALACSMSPPEMTTGETHPRAKEPTNRAKNPLRKRAAPFLMASTPAAPRSLVTITTYMCPGSELVFILSEDPSSMIG